MALIYGQIGSLKTLREKLNSRGIDRFNSISEINFFLDNYISERDEINERYRSIIENEINYLEEKIQKDENILSNVIDINKQEIDIKIKQINCKIEIQKFNKTTFLINRLFTRIYLKYLVERVKYLEKYRSKIENISSTKIKKSILRDNKILIDTTDNKNSIIENISAHELNKLYYTRELIFELNPFIAGAIGENLVSKEINKLSDEFILINDFSLKFEKPIHNKDDNDRIHSIQIDHLLISKAGIFILETKNWSKKSLESLDLRSPVKQVKRFNYALQCLIHNKDSKYKIKLDKHHWGDKIVPIKNVIVMINNKPKDQFNMVSITSVNELNEHLNLYEPIFNNKEFKKIVDTIIKMNDKETIKY